MEVLPCLGTDPNQDQKGFDPDPWKNRFGSDLKSNIKILTLHEITYCALYEVIIKKSVVSV